MWAPLHEHPARATSGVEHPTAVRLDDVDNHLHDRHRCEELTPVVGLLIGKLSQEVLVDAPENVSVGTLECRVIEGAQNLAEYVVV